MEIKPKIKNNKINRNSIEFKIKEFNGLDLNNKGFELLKHSAHVQKQILETLSNKEVADILTFLDPDQATDILRNIVNHSKRRRIIEYLNSDTKEKVEYLLRFSFNTAAGLMDLNYIEVEENAVFKDLSVSIEKHVKRTGRVPLIIVIKDGFPIGEIPIYLLALHGSKEKITEHIKKISTVDYDVPSEKILKLFLDNPHKKVIVVDDKKSILGIIYSDDIIRQLKRNNSNSLYEFAGLEKEDDVFDPILIKFKHRYKWLVINLFTAFLAASVVSLFSDTINKFVFLAAYMPIIAGMGGNAATQTLAVMVRGIAMKEVSLSNCFRAIFTEVGAGILNGILNGLFVATIAIIFNQNPMLGLVLGVALIVNLLVAGFFGAVVPLVMKHFGKDPATSATIFITTATDVFGFLVFLGLATLLL